MRYLMIVGATLGFAMGLVMGWLRDNSGPTVLFRAAIAACIGGWLLRWWGRVWVRSVQESLQEQHAAQARAPASAPTQPHRTRL